MYINSFLEHTSFLTIASYVFFGGGAYGSLPDAAIWWCLQTGGGGVLSRMCITVCVPVYSGPHFPELDIPRNFRVPAEHTSELNKD